MAVGWGTTMVAGGDQRQANCTSVGRVEAPRFGVWVFPLLADGRGKYDD